jgi:beta-glucosidase
MSSKLVTVLEGLAEKIKGKPAIAFEYRLSSLMYEDIHQGFQTFGAAGHVDAPITLDGTDVVIACYGLDGAMEGEEGDAIASDANGDRDSIELPPWQINFLRRVRKGGKKVVLILTGGSAIAFPPDIADAILFAWYPGEEGGNAVADIVFGDTVPSGKLPVTFPVSTAQLPPYDDYSMSAKDNGKGRTYRYMKEEPLYPFGFGLSYTTFEFGDAAHEADGHKVTVTVKNTGKCDAEEVVQVYVTRDGHTDDEPACSLKGFKRVAVKAGGSAQAVFELGQEAFETVNAEGKSVLLPGTYTVTVADSAPIAGAQAKGAAKPVSFKVEIK